MSVILSEPSIEIYRSIIDHNPDAIVIISLDGEIVESNEALTKIFGYTKQEIHNRHCNEIVTPEYVDVVNENFAKVLQYGVPCEYETKAFHKNDSVLCLQIKKIPLIVSGEIVGVFGV